MKKIVLITGAAKGIGKAIAIELAKEGYDIVINFLHSEIEANTLKDELINNYHVNALAIKADVRNKDEVDMMVTSIENKLGSVDVLINNAAIDLPNLFSNKTSEEFIEVLKTNVIGAFNTAKRVYKNMYDKKWGRIINISSTNGINTYYPMCLDYDASKAALNSLTHNLAMEFAPYINVNAIAPGFIGSESELEGYDEEFLKSEQEKILLKRYGKPIEVAHLVKFLISDEADYINNAIIRIDGGQVGSN